MTERVEIESPRPRRGDVREDGKMFWQRQPGYANNERWLDPETFYRYKNHVSVKGKAYRAGRKKESLANYRAWRKKNRQKVREIRNKYRNKRRATDATFLICDRVRNLTTQAFRVHGYSKKSRTQELLGCSWEDLKSHIESQFKEGMSWENRRLWHVDHIMPLSSAKTEEELIPLFKYTNLQPLWAADNIKKHNKIPS